MKKEGALVENKLVEICKSKDENENVNESEENVIKGSESPTIKLSKTIISLIFFEFLFNIMWASGSYCGLINFGKLGAHMAL